MSQPEQIDQAEQYLKENAGYTPHYRFDDCEYSWDGVIGWMEEYASQQTASLQKQIELLQIRDEKREARESNLHKENGGLHAQIESLQKQVEELRKELTERQNTILNQQEIIYSLKVENEDLKQITIDLLNNEDVREYLYKIKPLESEVERLKDLLKRSIYLAENSLFPTYEFKETVNKALKPQDNQKEK